MTTYIHPAITNSVKALNVTGEDRPKRDVIVNADVGRDFAAAGYHVVFSHYFRAGGKDKSHPDYWAIVKAKERK